MALQANWGARRNGPSIVYFEVSRHRGEPASANCLAHRFVKKSCDDSAVEKPRVAFETVWDADRTDNRSVLCEEEFKLQAVPIRLSAAEAAILSSM
jgi:hypothetical protein